MTRYGPVLLIDDHDDVREGLRMLLEADGWVVVTACDGREALNKIVGGLRPCIILLDLMSPVMNGLEFRQELMHHAERLPIPMLAYAGLKNVQAKARQRALNQSAPLPVEIDRLMAAVRHSCG